MYIISIHYPNADGATFDHEYYRTKHLPEVGKAFRAFRTWLRQRFEGRESADGKAPAYFVTTILSFRDEQGARKPRWQGRQALRADIANFTNVTPVVQFNTSVP